MKNTCMAAFLGVVCLLSAGCLEETYISAAPDGTIAICAGGKLVRVAPDLASASLVTEGVMRAEYSPDGAKLLCAFLREEGDGKSVEMVVTDPDAKPLVSIDKWPLKKDGGAARMISPRWSPDGAYVSYLVPDPEDADSSDLAIRQADGSHVLAEPIQKVSAGYAWSADSTRVAVISSLGPDADEPALGLVQVWEIPGGEKDDVATVLFSPWLWTGWDYANDRVLFSAAQAQMPCYGAYAPEGLIQLYAALDEYRRVLPILDPPGLGMSGFGIFEISPDGAKIAYVSWLDEETAGISVVNTDGSERQVVAEPVTIHALPRWVGPNRLAYQVEEKTGGKSETKLYVQDIGGKPRDILPILEPVVNPEGAAKSEGAAAAAPVEDIQSSDSR